MCNYAAKTTCFIAVKIFLIEGVNKYCNNYCCLLHNSLCLYVVLMSSAISIVKRKFNQIYGVCPNFKLVV